MVGSKQTAYTLLEILIVLSVSAILMRFALLNFVGIRQSARSQQVEYQLEAVINKAIERAQRYGARTILKTSSDGRSYSLGIDDFPYSIDPLETDRSVGSYKLRAEYQIEPELTLIFNHNSNLITEDGSLTSTSFNLKENYTDGTYQDFVQVNLTATAQIIFSDL